MVFQRNARLGLAGRRALVADVESGCSCREAARRRGVSPTTACKWWGRWSGASPEERRTLVCLEDRSSRPLRLPRLLPAVEQERICVARRRTGWGPRLIAGETGHAHASVWRALKRAGISRPPREPREQSRRYEWPCPGDLLHIDSKRFVRFTRPGHALTGDRHRTSAERRMRVGHEWVHSLVDDHSRYAYSELHRDEKAETVTGFVERGLAHFAAHGIEVKRLISDNAWTYTRNKTLARLLARPQHPPPADPLPPTAGQWQGRALPADAQARMGARAALPLQRPPRPGAVTLGQLLQRAQTPQLTRRPITDQSCPQRPEAGHLGSGASRARTGDLLSARQTLSQLSYGPVAAQCSGEFEVLGPVDPPSLIVLGRNKSKLNSRESIDSMNGNQKAAVKLIAVSRNCVDLVARVRPLEHSRSGPATGIAANHKDVAIERRRLTLHSKQTRSNVQDEIVPLVGDRSKYSDS
jgi:transposase